MSSSQFINGTSVTPEYRFMFKFEREFQHQYTRDWMLKNWTSGFYWCAAYLTVIFTVRLLMRNRPRYRLKKQLIIWNSCLAIFSIIGASRTLPELVHVLRNFGIQHSCCIQSFIENDRVSGFWSWLFTLSKVPELGDTIFVVLRKQPLMFLHWYHHTTVLLYTWYAYKEYTSAARWFITMNYCVHAVMYSYYALRAMGTSPPKFAAMIITTMQITQMFLGCLVNYWSYKFLSAGQFCHISLLNIQLSTAMYFSYFLLFANFFYRTYIKNSASCRKMLASNGTVKDSRESKLKDQ